MTRARLGALLVPFVVAAIAPGFAAAQSGDERSALVVFVPGVSFEQLVSIPEIASLARAGGAGLLANPEDVAAVDGGLGSPERELVLDPAELGGIESVGQEVRAAVEELEATDLLVLVVGSEPDARVRDEVAGIVLASGSPRELFPETGEPGSLTSDSTRRRGIVTGGDVLATVTAYLGSAPLVASELLPGEPIRIVDGPPPFDLHERYQAQRRTYVPIGTAAALYVTGGGLVALALLFRRRSVPEQWQRIMGWVALSVPMLATGLLAAGHLPELTYATVIPMVAIVTVFGTMAFSPLERRELTVVPAGIGAAVIAFFVVEALLGWSGMLTPLIGGSQLDGGRFFGLPNVAIGLLVGASMWVAQRVSTATGFALTCSLALFAGLSFVGANLGASVTLFAAAGLWLAVRERERLGLWMGLVVFAMVTAVGTGVILVSHAISPFATHVTRFEQGVEGIGEIWDTFLDRLQVGFDLIARSPAALVPVVGIVAVLVLVLRPPAPIRDTFERWPEWRDANLVIALAGMVAYLSNDSGPAAVGFAFGLALGGMLGVPLLAGTRKMEEP